jgi:hypothetical protein
MLLQLGIENRQGENCSPRLIVSANNIALLSSKKQNWY